MVKITVQNTPISVIGVDGDDYISLTDTAKSQLQKLIIFRWLSLKGCIEYLGEWEMLYNPDFDCTEFGTIKIKQIAIHQMSVLENGDNDLKLLKI